MNVASEQVFIVNNTESVQRNHHIQRAFTLAGAGASLQSEEAQTSMCLVQSMDPLSRTQTCRLCATVTELVVPIFEGEGLQNNLADKIHQHLPIQVSEKDHLPVVMCFQCTSTLLAWHELVVCSVQADSIMRERFNVSYSQQQQQQQPNLQCSQKDIKDEKLQPLTKIINSVLTEYLASLKMECGVQLVCHRCVVQPTLTARDFPDHLITTHHAEVLNANDIDSFIKNYVTFEEPLGSDLDSDRNDDATELTKTVKKTALCTLLCPYCDSGFSSTTRLVHHLGKHVQISLDEGVKCCHSIYNTKKEFVAHLQEKHVNRLLFDAETMCKSCNYTADSVQRLRDHVEAAHGENKIKEVKRKSDKNQKWIPAVCPECNKTFSNKYNMFNHMKSHDKMATYVCDVCNKRYSTKGNLRAHVKLCHEGAMSHVCGWCGERFPARAARDVHARVHTGDRPHRCDLCGAAFRARDSLRRHLDMHLDVRNHRCDVCGKTFRKRSHLVAHFTKHRTQWCRVAARACVRCEHCARYFPDTHLRAHLLAAHAPLLFLCAECHLYRNRKDMIAHMMTHIEKSKNTKTPEETTSVDKQSTPKTVIPLVRIQRLSRLPAPPPLVEMSSLSIPLANNLTNSSPIGASETIESPLQKKQSNTLETHNPLQNQLKTDSSGIGIENADSANETIPLEQKLVKEIDKTQTPGRNNDFSDHSDIENDFGRLPESVFDAIEDSQDGNEAQDKSVPETKKPNVPRPCPVCDKQCNSISGWYYHLKHTHGSDKNLACDYCNKLFAGKSELAIHIRTHTKDKPFECRSCSSRFTSRAGRYIHERTHSDRKVYICNRCPRAFRWRAQLNRHETRHDSVKNHVCPRCGRGFTIAFDLLRHVRSHSPGTHRCEVCNATFKQKRYLKVHMENIHLASSKTCKKAKVQMFEHDKNPSLTSIVSKDG